MENEQRQERFAGLIYAGGRGVRMGGVDKALIMHENLPLIAHMSRALDRYVDQVFITRQADQSDVSQYGKVVVDIEGDQGPLAGMVTAIGAASEFDYLLTAAVDSVNLPSNYLTQLRSVACPHAMAQTGEHVHPTFALINLSQRQEILAHYELGARALRSWVSRENCGYAQFATGEIQNINQS